MSLTINGEYLGLPVPDDNEYEMFQKYLTVSDEETIDTEMLPLECLFELVATRRPFIRNVIENDISEYMDLETDEDISLENIQICDGIKSGYEFMVGCVTFMRFLRSGHLSLEDYINSVPKKSTDLPLQKSSQLMRTKKVLSGVAIHDVIHTDLIDDSSELAYLDTGDYFFDAAHMDTIVENEVDKLMAENPDCNEEDSKYIEGFYIGIEHTVEMYIQSREQHYIDNVHFLL